MTFVHPTQSFSRSHSQSYSPSHSRSPDSKRTCNQRRLCDDPDCQPCFQRSFAASDKAPFWSQRNLDRPRHCFRSSRAKRWFNCLECHHAFEATLDKSTHGRWCPFCAKQKLCDVQDCKQCFQRSFAASDKAPLWSSRNPDTPRHCFLNNHSKRWFNCSDCHHDFEASLANITSLGCWCPYCNNPPQKLCDDQDCQQCFARSFSASDKAPFWSSRNPDTPRQSFLKSHTKRWFNCGQCHHEFEASLVNITNAGSWCPFCVNKTEQKLLAFLRTHFSDVKPQFRVDWCRSQTSGRVYPFDFRVLTDDVRVIIELDGAQHFRQVSNWAPPKHTLDRDIYKMKCAQNHGYCVIRLLQEDVLDDRYDWASALLTAVQQCVDTRHQGPHKTPPVVYLCQSQEYADHIDAMDEYLLIGTDRS